MHIMSLNNAFFFVHKKHKLQNKSVN